MVYAWNPRKLTNKEPKLKMISLKSLTTKKFINLCRKIT